ncbi:MAG: cytochrome b [Rhodobacteraceae bacterium]|nr:cytochrome b [Paracoccaceae bacterium]
MQIKSTDESYGLIARLLHWGMAAAILAMFALGYWMRTLDYYSPWYKQAPDIHKGVGMILMALLVFRMLWRVLDHRPDDKDLKAIERKLSHLLHTGFYLLLVVLMIAGYLIATLDGRVIDVFGWIEVPSLHTQKGLEETAGWIHEFLAYLLMGLVALHAAAALKHHFVDRDKTLLRMLRSGKPNS